MEVIKSRLGERHPYLLCFKLEAKVQKERDERFNHLGFVVEKLAFEPSQKTLKHFVSLFFALQEVLHVHFLNNVLDGF